MSDNEERIHPATPARQQQAWRDGDFAKSYELSAAIQLLGGLLIAAGLFSSLAGWLKTTTLQIYATPLPSRFRTADIVEQLQSILYSSLTVIGGIGALLVLLAVASHWCQTGVVLLGNRISPEVQRLSPTHWFARVFSFSGLVGTLICVPKVLLALTVMFLGCWFYRESFFQLGVLPADQLGGAVLQLAVLICGQVGLVLLLGSALDYWMKYLSYQNRIQMTDQELREEEKMQSRKAPRVNRRQSSLSEAADPASPTAR